MYIPGDVVLELLISGPLALVEDVAQEDDQLRLEIGDGRLEGAVHLPLATQLVEPVALSKVEDHGHRPNRI